MSFFSLSRMAGEGNFELIAGSCGSVLEPAHAVPELSG
jgi:hypothetical protein